MGMKINRFFNRSAYTYHNFIHKSSEGDQSFILRVILLVEDGLILLGNIELHIFQELIKFLGSNDAIRIKIKFLISKKGDEYQVNLYNILMNIPTIAAFKSINHKLISATYLSKYFLNIFISLHHTYLELFNDVDKTSGSSCSYSLSESSIKHIQMLCKCFWILDNLLSLVPIVLIFIILSIRLVNIGASIHSPAILEKVAKVLILINSAADKSIIILKISQSEMLVDQISIGSKVFKGIFEFKEDLILFSLTSDDIRMTSSIKDT